MHVPSRNQTLRHLRPENAPASGGGYWIALCLASNTGDMFASAFGFLAGLPLLAAAFTGILVLERRSATPREAWYGIAIIVVRTAATNLADFAAHAFGMVPAAAGITAVLVGALALRAGAGGLLTAPKDKALPAVDGLYWAAMLIAGTLGTGIGDFASFRSGLGLDGASLFLSALVAVLATVAATRSVAPLFYWLVVVAVRAAGTSVGDFSAHQFGLWQGTLAAAAALTGFLLLRPRASALWALPECRSQEPSAS